jgi:hypothetical protein
MPVGAPIIDSDASSASPMTKTLLIVPTPGRWRSGIQSSSTTS